MEQRDNPAILKKYILSPRYEFEYLVNINLEPDYRLLDETIPNPKYYEIMAVYKPTGRKFKNIKDLGFEYEFVGVRVISHG